VPARRGYAPACSRRVRVAPVVTPACANSPLVTASTVPDLTPLHGGEVGNSSSSKTRTVRRDNRQRTQESVAEETREGTPPQSRRGFRNSSLPSTVHVDGSTERRKLRATMGSGVCAVRVGALVLLRRHHPEPASLRCPASIPDRQVRATHHATSTGHWAFPSYSPSTCERMLSASDSAAA